MLVLLSGYLFGPRVGETLRRRDTRGSIARIARIVYLRGILKKPGVGRRWVTWFGAVS